VLYIPFINFLSKGDHIYSGEMNTKQRVLGVIALTPLIILLLISVDLLYTVQGVIFPLIHGSIRLIKGTIGVLVMIIVLNLMLVLFTFKMIFTCFGKY
jgi:hypothetical protein